MHLQRGRLAKIRNHQTRVNNQCESPLNSLSIIMPKVSKESFDTGDGKEDATEDVEILIADEVGYCVSGVIGAEDARVVEGYVDGTGDEKGEEPKTDDGGED